MFYTVREFGYARRAGAGAEQRLRARLPAWFVTDIESVSLPPGLDEDTIRAISRIASRNSCSTGAWRLQALRRWSARLGAAEHRADRLPGAVVLLGAQVDEGRPKSLDEVDPKLLETYEKLGVPLHERAALAGVAVDAVFDSVSVGTTFRKQLADVGVIFCSFSHAVQNHPELVEPGHGGAAGRQLLRRAQLGGVLRRLLRLHPRRALPDGAVVVLPHQRAEHRAVRAHADHCRGRQPGQLPGRLHRAAARREPAARRGGAVAHDDAFIKYSTVQNWYPGDENGGWHLQLRHQARPGAGKRSRIAWTQIETGSAITWKYPSVVLRGDDSSGEFHSIAVSNHFQQADTGTKMIHLGRNTSSRIVSKGISAGHAHNSYRGLVRINPGAAGARNHTQCDSLLIGPTAAPTPSLRGHGARDAVVEHEATTTRISEERLFYCQQRGIDPQEATALIVGGFCQAVLEELPMEFALEAKALLAVSLEGAVG
jgi:Fe-S cluster assembly protein SufB